MRKPNPACAAAITELTAQMGPLSLDHLCAFLPYPRGLIRSTLRTLPAACVETMGTQCCRNCSRRKPLDAFVEREDGSHSATCEACVVAVRHSRERATPAARAWRAFVSIPAINPAPLRWAA